MIARCKGPISTIFQSAPPGYFRSPLLKSARESGKKDSCHLLHAERRDNFSIAYLIELNGYVKKDTTTKKLTKAAGRRKKKTEGKGGTTSNEPMNYREKIVSAMTDNRVCFSFSVSRQQRNILFSDGNKL